MNTTPGWQHLIDSFEQEILFDEQYANGPPAKLCQVFDKGKRLFLDYEGGDRLTDGYARLLQNLSEKTCKECGKPGDFKFIPVCDECQ